MKSKSQRQANLVQAVQSITAKKYGLAICGTVEDHRKISLQATCTTCLEDTSSDMVTHLEQATNPTENPYQKSRLDHPGVVEPKDDVEDTGDLYVIKSCWTRVSSGRTQYLVRWHGYG